MDGAVRSPENIGKRRGWFFRDGKWFLTLRTATRKFGISKKDLLKVLSENKIETRVLTIPYSLMVYSFEDLERFIPQPVVKPLAEDYFEQRAYMLSQEIMERQTE